METVRPATPQEGFAALLAEQSGLEAFTQAVARVVDRRMPGRQSDSYSVDTLAFLAVGLSAPSGMVLEFGVFSGQSINHLAARLPERKVYGFDSFAGLPEAWRPGFEKGALRRADLPPVAGNAVLVVGWFDRTLPGFLDAHPDEPAALLHVDCDLYSSTQTVFAQLAERIVPGTIIVFDEYFNYPGWMDHEFKAFQEFAGTRRLHYDYVGLVPSHQRVAVRVLGLGG